MEIAGGNNIIQGILDSNVKITGGETDLQGGKIYGNADITGGKLKIDSLVGLVGQGDANINISGGQVSGENGWNTSEEIENGDTIMGNNIRHDGTGAINVTGGEIDFKDHAAIVAKDGNINIAGGKINLSNGAEVWSQNVNAKTIISDNADITMTSNAGITPEGTLEINGGKIVATNSEVAGITAFKMTGGSLTLNNGAFGSEGPKVNPDDDSSHKGGKVEISGGTININPVTGANSELTNKWDYKSNMLLGKDIVMSDGEMNISKSAILALRDGYAEDSLLGDVSTLALTGGTLNLAGTFDGNIIAGETTGTVSIIDSNAKINGNMHGVNVNINSDFNSDNITGIVNYLDTLTVADGKSLTINLTDDLTGASKGDTETVSEDLNVKSFIMDKGGKLTINGPSEYAEKDLEATDSIYVANATISLNNAGLKQGNTSGTGYDISDSQISLQNNANLTDRSDGHDMNITNSNITMEYAGIFKERGKGNLNITNSEITMSKENGAVAVITNEQGNINIKGTTLTMNSDSFLGFGEYDDELKRLVPKSSRWDIILDEFISTNANNESVHKKSVLNMYDTASVLAIGTGMFALKNGSELNVYGNNAIRADSDVEIQNSTVNIGENAVLTLHEPETRPEDGGTIHLGEGSVLNLFGTLDGNLIGDKEDKTKAGTLNIMTQSSDITGIAHWLNIGLQANSTFIGEDIFIYNLTVGNDDKKAVQLTVDGDNENNERARGTIDSLTIKDGATVLAKTSTATWDQTGELDAPTEHGVHLSINKIQVDKGATLSLNGNGNHSVDISDVKTATINGTLNLINGRLEGDLDEDPNSTITIDGADISMKGTSNIEAGGAIMIKNSTIDMDVDDHGIVSATSLDIQNSSMTISGKNNEPGQLIAYKKENAGFEGKSSGNLTINGSTLNLKDETLIYGENIHIKDTAIDIEGQNYILSHANDIQFDNTQLTIAKDKTLTTLTGKDINGPYPDQKEVDDYDTVLIAYNTLDPNRGTLNLSEKSVLTNNGTINADINNLSEVLNNGTILGNVMNTGTLTSLVNGITGSITNTGTFNASGTLDKAISGTGTTKVDGVLTFRDTASVAGILDLNNGSAVMSGDNETGAYSIGTLAGTGSIKLDVNTLTNISDQFVIANNASETGTITIDEMTLLGDQTPETVSDFEVKVLNGGNANLALTDALKNAYHYEHTEQKTDVVTETVSWNDAFKVKEKTDTRNLSVFQSVADGAFDSVRLETISTGWLDKDSLGDTLNLINNLKTDNAKGFNFTSANDVYTLTTHLGTTNGVLNINGVAEGNTLATINLDKKTGFNLDQNSTLSVSNARITGNEVIITNNGGHLTFNNANIVEGKITGTGNATNTGTLNISADNLDVALVNNETLNLGSGTLNKAISGEGNTYISGNVVNNSTIGNHVTISSGYLSSYLNGLMGTLTNNSVFNILDNEVHSDKGIVGNGVINLAPNATVFMGSYETLFANASELKMGNGSKIALNNGTALVTTLNNLSIASGDIVDIDMDWGDVLEAGDKVLGNVNLASIDLTSTTGEGSQYTFTNTIADKVLLDSNVSLITTDTSNKWVKYDATTGLLSSGPNKTIEDIISGNDEGEMTTVDVHEDVAFNTDQEIKGTVVIEGKKKGNGKATEISGAGVTVSGKGSLVMKNANLVNIITNNKGAFTAEPGGTIEIVAGDSDIEISGSKTEGNQSHNALYLSSNGAEHSKAHIKATGKNKIHIKDDIRSNSKNNIVRFEGKVALDGILDPLTTQIVNGTLTRNNYDEEIDHNLESGGSLVYADDRYLYDADYHTNLNGITFNGGTLDIHNGTATALKLASLTLKDGTTSSIYADVDLENETMDHFTNDTLVSGTGKLNIAGLNLISDATKDMTNITFTENEDLINATSYTGPTSGLQALSPKYSYDVAYKDGEFEFTRKGNNPAVYSSGIASQIVGVLTSNINSIAFAGLSGHNNLLQGRSGGDIDSSGSTWVKLVGFDDDVDFDSFQAVNSKMFSVIGGMTTDRIKIGHSDIKLGVYAGYIDGKAKYTGNRINQNGGYLGLSSSWTKDNLILNGTINAGLIRNEADQSFGKDKYNTTWIAAGLKVGYNYNLTNDVVLQPNFYAGYTLADTEDYTSKSGVKINNEKTHLFEYAPGLKLSKIFNNTWHGFIQGKYAFLENTGGKVKASDVALPDISLDNYAEYGIGLSKDFANDWQLSLTANRRDGGREGWNGSVEFKYHF
ncbi:MAG: autotransporter outer membrane beta-barrel domain-containing protein [Pseudomonadota bacterium]|nr:autotransporter outer membrane beta-barrel domain-containing protein [Pseudomonadota bacterium]